MIGTKEKLTQYTAFPSQPQLEVRKNTYYKTYTSGGNNTNFGNLQQSVEHNGNWTRYENYDSKGRALKVDAQKPQMVPPLGIEPRSIV